MMATVANFETASWTETTVRSFAPPSKWSVAIVTEKVDGTNKLFTMIVIGVESYVDAIEFAALTIRQRYGPKPDDVIVVSAYAKRL